MASFTLGDWVGRATIGFAAIAWLGLVPAVAQVPAADLKLTKPPAERRVALVIGNGAYQGAAVLANPVNDARAMAAKLKTLGFEVVAVENGNQQIMRRAIGQFSSKLAPDAVSLFYYAGHGIQASGHNYLIPVDAQIASEQTVRLETIDVDAVLDQMSMARSRVNLVILDACRNNPFERRFRSVSGGLASIEAPTGTLIAYATSPGKVAADGTGGNGLYTSELLDAIATPGAKVEAVFKQVRARVIARSNGDQTPWEASSLTGDFYFVGPTTVIVAPGAGGTPLDRETVLWTSVKDSRNPALIQTYLDQFPQGVFAGAAKVMIEDLRRAPRSAPPPPQLGAAPPPQVAVLAPHWLDGTWQGQASGAEDGARRLSIRSTAAGAFTVALSGSAPSASSDVKVSVDGNKVRITTQWKEIYELERDGDDRLTGKLIVLKARSSIQSFPISFARVE